jgi:ABC-type multidrug transport system fused ATPase/permease subunit
MQRFRKLTRSLSTRGTQVATIGGRMQGMAAAAVAGSGALVLALAANEASAGRLTGGALVTFYTLLGLLVPVFQRIALANRYFQEAHISIEYFTSVMEETPEAPKRDARPALDVSTGYMSVEHVSFRYGKEEQALRQVQLEAQRGEIVAIVGANGAGKSTLLDLLLCFRRPTSGRILIDDQDINEVALASLRSQIGLVDQNAMLFDGTIAQNIAYGVQHGVPEEQIQRAATLAGVDQIVAALPKGWDTPVGAGGQSLSGGQRQRIALARALAGDPPFLVLDEATSAVDAETEQALAAMLRELAHNKTIIVAAHRLPTLLLADRIYVLEQGRIAESGTHTALLQRGGVYTRLFGEASKAHTKPVQYIENEVTQWSDEVFHL